MMEYADALYRFEGSIDTAVGDAEVNGMTTEEIAAALRREIEALGVKL